MQRGKDRRELFRAIRVMRLPHEQERGVDWLKSRQTPYSNNTKMGLAYTILSEVVVLNNLGGLGHVKGLEVCFRPRSGWSVNENHQGEALLTQGKQGRGELQRFWNWY